MVPDYLFKVAKKKQNFGKVARSCSSAKKLLRGQKVAKKLPSTIWLCLITLTELCDNDDITKVYVDSGLRVGAVRVDQLHLVYAGYLKPLGVDLVVFSKAKSDTVVYDSRLGDNNEIVRITDKIIYLWLNDSHDD